MDGLSSNSFLMMQRSMEFLWSKQSCILDNIANVETPGYQVKYATFEETPVVVREAQESVRMDGNGVNITEQSVELARNGYQMQYVFGAISSDIATLQAVIRG